MASLQSCAERWQADSFYDHHQAEDHFITDPMRSDRTARTLARRISMLLGDNEPLEIFDVGAGNGDLLRALADYLPNACAFHGVDVREQPGAVPGIWHRQDAHTLPARSSGATPILICHEFFDDVPCDLVEVDSAGIARLLIIDAADDPILGPALTDPAAGPDREWILRWVQRWWPATRPYMRIEVGRQRDALWRHYTKGMHGGLAFAIDYGHLLRERLVGTWDGGTAVGWRHGRPVPLRWDASRNITAHVAMDALAHASAGSTVRLSRQRRAFGLPAHRLLSTGGSGDYLWLEADLRDLTDD
jgi:SAM-dependent MidA family methyltransferase